MDATDVGADLKQVLISADQVRQRVGELAAEIDADYAGRELLLVGVLKGAVMIMAARGHRFSRHRESVPLLLAEGGTGGGTARYQRQRSSGHG